MSAKPHFDKNVHVLVMAGGSGTRFWPRSRQKKPKQLLPLWDDRTLLEHTISRFTRHLPMHNIWVITNHALVEPSKDALGAAFNEVRFLGEPEAKSTAPCILWGLKEIAKVDPEAVVIIQSADSYIGNETSFLAGLQTAAEHARKTGALVTIGIKPERPETGYGYIELESKPKAKHGVEPLRVVQFVEKPDLRTANRYLETGKYLWNAGMFIMTLQAGLEAFKKTMPHLSEIFESGKNVKELFASIGKNDAISVDYGVMEPAIEKGLQVAVVPVDCGWNDVGSFSALEEIDCSVRGELVTLNSNSNVVQSDAGLVALLGVNDLVVVRDKDVVLVAAKDRLNDMKALLEKVRKEHADKL